MLTDKNLYAHTKADSTGKSDWQTLENHLTGTAELAAGGDPFKEKIFDALHSSELLYTAGLLHDIGKADPEFQNYLEQAAEAEAQGDSAKYRCRVNHSEAGAAWSADNLGPFPGTMLAYLIAGHHAGLPDWNTDGNASLHYRLNAGRKNLEKINDSLDPVFKEIKSHLNELMNSIKESSQILKIIPANYHLWVRMLFSRLVDADRLNTEAFCDPDQAKARKRFLTISELKEKFDLYMSEHFSSPEKESSDSDPSKVFSPDLKSASSSASEQTADPTARRLQKARSEVLNACRSAGKNDHQNHLFTLTVPTGGGKTLSSMAFALEYAVAHHKDRIIYVIPYTSIIEQTADVFRRVFGPENIVEHHCNFNAENTLKKTNGSADGGDLSYEMRMNLAAENWDAPIILTTNVQFFESLYSAKPSRCRKIHRIADSIVILDEAQMLETKFLSPCVDIMNLLTESFGTAIVLCTATQPALSFLNQTHQGVGKLHEARPILSSPDSLYRDLSRVRYEFDQEIKFPALPSSGSCVKISGNAISDNTWNRIADELEQYEEVLCIVNTRRDAYDLYSLLKEREKERRTQREESQGINLSNEPRETVHLSALMCGEHRSRVINAIRKRLDQNRQNQTKHPLRVVSTQLVEAGVDIDFPFVFRSLAGLDSIAQAAGRCNREGRLGPDGGLVRVFIPPKPAPAGILRKGADASVNLFSSFGFDPQNPESYTNYFKLFYSSLVSLDSENILQLLSADVSGQSQEVPFRSVGEKFKLITDQGTNPVYVLYEDGAKLIDRLRREGIHRALMRTLQRYCVNATDAHLFELKKEGLTEEIFPGIHVQAVPDIYKDDIGLDLFSESRFSPLII